MKTRQLTRLRGCRVVYNKDAASACEQSSEAKTAEPQASLLQQAHSCTPLKRVVSPCPIFVVTHHSKEWCHPATHSCTTVETAKCKERRHSCTHVKTARSKQGRHSCTTVETARTPS